MYVIGTAGHVDHGKSALVEALTGVDPDRWREEKERGLTIDLGFAPLTLPSGEKVSIVDVPGHERLIKNMLAGVGGIDLALLVVAADEGVMPQTREHLAIIDLLGINSGVVALTKNDLVDAETLGLAEAELRDELAGTTLVGAPIVPCSARTGAGLDRLVARIEQRLRETAPNRDIGRPRLPVDRAFTMAGFGTVVTGTLIDGSLSVGQEIEVLPGGSRARIRGLQHHGEQVDTARPGKRTAVNLTGVAVRDLARGMVLAPPGMFGPVSSLDARLRAVRHLSRPIRHNTEVTLHTGSAEAAAKLLLLEADEMTPGESGWAQVRLREPVVCVPGDGFILRDPNDTLGGGQIIAIEVPRHRRHHAPTLAALELLARGTPAEVLLSALEAGPATLREAAAVAGYDDGVALSAARELVTDGRVAALSGEPFGHDSLVISSTSLDQIVARIVALLAAYHAKAPLRRGIPREELRSHLGLQPGAFAAVLAALEARGAVRCDGPLVSDPAHEPRLTKGQAAEAVAYVELLRASPYSPPTDNRPDAELMAYLEDSGDIIRIGDVAFATEAYEAMVKRVVDQLRAEGPLTLGQVRDMFGTSRKYAQTLLEHLDAKQITRREGDLRVLR
jgi:selenocysteine-specific elongation factor